MNIILQQKILTNLMRLVEIAKDRNYAPVNCSIYENDLWVTFYADIPEIDVDDMYDYLGTGMYERR